MITTTTYFDLSAGSFWFAIASIVFNPLFWNIVARKEYENQFLTKLFAGNKYNACYALAAAIFTLGIFRDKLFSDALAYQPTLDLLGHPVVQVIAALMYVVGTFLVVVSMWKLGVTGTYLGDYFGILLKEPVAGFPFDVMRDPMYNGSTILFLAHAISYRSPAGILMALIVHIVYQVALTYEAPFTQFIYKQRAERRKGMKKNKFILK